jgi:DNA-binding response OmpR family regulator
MAHQTALLSLIHDAAQRHQIHPAGGLDTALLPDPLPRRLGVILDHLAHAPTPRRGGAAKGFAIGPHQFIPADRVLICNDETIRLTEKECDILLTLYDADGKSVSRQTLLDQVWGYASNVETHTLETHIYRVRQKIEIDPAAPAFLLTDEQGYLLVR